MTEKKRKKNTGEPTTNGGEFASKTNADAEVSLSGRGTGRSAGDIAAALVDNLELQTKLFAEENDLRIEGFTNLLLVDYPDAVEVEFSNVSGSRRPIVRDANQVVLNEDQKDEHPSEQWLTLVNAGADQFWQFTNGRSWNGFIIK